MPEVLPIDAVLGQVLASLERDGNVVLLAPPGAGKTTRVPPAALAAGLAGRGEIVVVEPRRLAARMAARRVAHELGEQVGARVGYEVRFDRAVSSDTRLRFVTEGVLSRQLVSDPSLSRVGLVIIDEFHERHLNGDLALALLRRLQRGPRPDLKLVVMSATLDPAPLAVFLGDCPVVISEGRQHPVTIEYARPGDTRPGDRRPLEARVAGAVKRALRADGATSTDVGGGDVLVFLPGAAEIRRSLEACGELSERAELVPLHGDLSSAEQDRAVTPGRRRKVVFATNVAESSITIDGVTWVIDTGLARVARHAPWSGIPSLRTEPISQASAAQRAGRAGRTAPGVCLRLYSQHDHDGRREFDAPEVARADLAEAALALHALGIAEVAEFAWFEPPPTAAVVAAETLLGRLGAITPDGQLTAAGRAMLALPVHPRQARVMLAAAQRGVGSAGCVLAALVGERPLRRAHRSQFAPARAGGAGPQRVARATVSAASDLIEDYDAFVAARRDRLRGQRLSAAGLDAGAFAAVERARRQLERALERLLRAAERAPANASTSGTAGVTIAAGAMETSSLSDEAFDEALQIATLAGYPDRVGRRRRPGSAEVVFAGGGSAELAATSVVIEAEFLVAVDARERDRGAQAVIHRASAIEPDWLLDLDIERVEDRDELRWDGERERVERVSQVSYDGLVLTEQRDPGGARSDPDRASEILAEAALAAGVERFCDRDQLDAWRRRVAFCAQQLAPAEAPSPADASAGEVAWGLGDDDLRAALRELCAGMSSFDELRRASLLQALRARLPAEVRAQLDRLAPTHVTIAGRQRVPVHYESDRPPWIESRLQDFFSMDAGPSVAAGRVALTLHLLAPNRRAVQVTSDLAGFWERHYPALRRQLMRRYPKHAWPEDPRTAKPPARGRGRRSKPKG